MSIVLFSLLNVREYFSLGQLDPDTSGIKAERP